LYNPIFFGKRRLFPNNILPPQAAEDYLHNPHQKNISPPQAAKAEF